MSKSYDTFGRPSNLEYPEDLSNVNYSVNSSIINPRWRLGADRTANIDDAMLLIDLLLKKYETTYKTHKTDSKLLLMPYLFSKPAAGTKIKNLNTDEIYSIKETINNPRTGLWEGLVRLNCIAAPDPLLSHRLEFIHENSLVRFTEIFPSMIGNENQSSSGLLIDKGPMRPTVIYNLSRKEPGGIDGKPFGSTKEYKYRVRETIKDPDSPSHTIELRGRCFDNIVQFDCCTTDNASANKLARWFEKFIDLYEWVLKLNGVQQILYWSRFTDTSSQKWRQDLVVRSIQYYFRTEEIEAITRRDITSVQLAANVANEIENTNTQYIAGQLVSGQISEQEYFSLFRDSTGKYLFGNLYYNDGNL